MASVYLVTGGAGFIGANFIHHLLRTDPDARVVNVDALTYAGNLENLAGVDASRCTLVHGDICEPRTCDEAWEAARSRFGTPVDLVVHFAAESHVDRSIEDPTAFLRTNILGTEMLLRAARQRGVGRFLHVSTDEVYGSLSADDPAFTELTPIAPNSPYAASKASSDLMVRAYIETYGLPALVTRCSNNYGPYQFPEKLIPLMIANALDDVPLPVYGDGMNVRDWIYVEDHVAGVLDVLHKGRVGEVYNLGGHAEMPNLAVVRLILQMLGKPESLIRYVTDRPGHDRRYAMDTTKVAGELGWQPRWTFERGMAETVRWYLEHRAWVANVRSGAYRDYYERMYGGRVHA